MSGLLLVWATFLLVAASPGPANLAMATTAMARGRRASVPMALGLTLGLWSWGIAAAAGLGAILLALPAAMTALRLLGGAYLLWLALQSARSALRRDGPDLAADARPARRLFLGGLLLNLSNPKAVLAWTSVLAVGLPEGSDPAMLVVALGGCLLLGAANVFGHLALFGTARARALYDRARRWIEAATAALLGAAGLRLLTERAA